MPSILSKFTSRKTAGLSKDSPATHIMDTTSTPSTRATMGRLLQFVGSFERNILVVAFSALVVSSATNLSFPKIMGKAIDYSVKTSDSPHSFKTLLTCVLATFSVGAIAGWLRVMCFNLAGRSIENRLRKRLFERILHQRPDFFDKNRSGELVTRLLQDVEVSSKAVTQGAASAMRSINSAIGGTVMLMLLSRKLTLVTLSLIPIVGTSAMLYTSYVKKLNRKLQDGLGLAMGAAEEKISNYRTVRLFGREEQEVLRFSGLLDSLYPLARSASCMEGVFMGGLGFAINVSLLSVLFFGGSLVDSGEMTIGSLTSFALYSSMVGLGFSGLSQVHCEMVKAATAAQRVFDIIGSPGESLDEGIMLTEKVSGEIVFKDVDFAYESRPEMKILKSFSLTINPRTIMAIAGSSGAGKTTVADLLTRLYSPTGGSIYLDGFNILELNPTWLRSSVFGVVNQEPVLFDGSLEENIKYGLPDASEEDIITAAKEANAHTFIDALPDKYQTQVGKQGTQLSVGQKQRLAIARAVIKRPACLILDEATSSLDGESERQLHVALERVAQGRTVLIIAHRESTLKIANEIVVLDDGCVAERGTYEALCKSQGLLSKLLHGNAA